MPDLCQFCEEEPATEESPLGECCAGCLADMLAMVCHEANQQLAARRVN